MKFLMVAVCPYEDTELVWIPYWLKATDQDEALSESKAIAKNLFYACPHRRDQFQFNIFRMDYPLPLSLTRTWISEFENTNPADSS